MNDKLICQHDIADKTKDGLMTKEMVKKLDRLQANTSDTIILGIDVRESTTDVEKIFFYANIYYISEVESMVYSWGRLNDIFIMTSNGRALLSETRSKYLNMSSIRFTDANIVVSSMDQYGNPVMGSIYNVMGSLTSMTVVSGNPLIEHATTGIMASNNCWAQAGSKHIVEDLFNGWVKNQGILIMHIYDEPLL